MTPDFILHRVSAYPSTIIFLTPESDTGQIWMEENIPLDQRRNGMLFLKSEDVLPLIQSLTAEGYVVK